MRKRSSILPALIMLCFCVLSSAQTIQEQQRKREQLEKDIAILQSQLTASSNRSEQALSALHLITAQKVSRQKLIRQSDAQIAGYNKQIHRVQTEIDRQQEALDTLQAHYSRLVQGAYKNRDVKLWYMYILASDNMSQAFRRFGYFKGLSEQIRSQAGEIEEAQAELNAKKAELLDLKRKEQGVRAQKQAEYEKLRADESRQAEIANKLKKDTRSYRSSLDAKQKEKRELDRQIARMIEEATGKKPGKKSKDVDIVLDKNFENNRGKLPWPVEGPVVEHFGTYRNKELRLTLYNNGVNIACQPSSLVKAVFDGVVSNIMLTPGYGQCILIQHGTYYTSYCKVKNVMVRPGDKVKTGQAIGEVSTIMGKTQLYFLVWKKNYLDPELWLRER